ncbi:bacteriocin-protection protein [Chitinophaga caeni]|uniref:Bacteriocin-protection protein n=1 Tax=Chitinophaga caeni TaxID=2029983 RepID=A0A291QVR3_9BACT|nr:YdeI/OmpD-associated family protein [Chitinophaga caeni]ATL48020.1 bacteriocin-protection protein [Chitinophaga caeni]
MDKPTFFKNAAAFKNWLKKNHDKETAFLVGFYKAGTGKPSMTWAESVEEALCYGWIDGMRKSIDEESYFIRFSPRKMNSTWSAKNIQTVAKLILEKRMQAPGLHLFENRAPGNTNKYSFENKGTALDANLQRILRNNKNAFKFFEQQAPNYKKVMNHWIMSAKQETTRLRRLEKLISACVEGKRLH